MKVALVQFTPWDKVYYFDPGDLKLVEEDFVVVETQLGVDMGKVVGFEEITEAPEQEIKGMTRKATREDLQKRLELDSEKEKEVENCKKMIDKHDLPMKLVDVHFSFDDKRVVFAFIAQGRIDFRDLVKDLTRHYQRSIRLQQIGIRDEMKMCGDIGPCGRGLCCQGFVKNLGNITSELAEEQQVAHRGSERLAGCCGRLRCCLAFENPVYKELIAKMPALGTIVKTPKGKGEVVGWHTLKETVDVRIIEGKEEEKIVSEFSISEIKK